MTHSEKRSRLDTHDVNLILEVLFVAAQEGMSVAEAARDRLAENEIDLRELARELRSGPHDRTDEPLKAMRAGRRQDSARVRRLMHMFASWRSVSETPKKG